MSNVSGVFGEGFDKFKGKIIKNALVELLPAKLIPIVLDRAFIAGNEKVSEITQVQRRRLVEILRGLPAKAEIFGTLLAGLIVATLVFAVILPILDVTNLL